MGEAKRRKKLDPNFGRRSLVLGLYKIVEEFSKPKTEEMRVALRYQCFDFCRRLAESRKDEVVLLAINFGDKPLLENTNQSGSAVCKLFTNPVWVGLVKLPLNRLGSLLPPTTVLDIEQKAKTIDLDSHRIGIVLFADPHERTTTTFFYPLSEIEEELLSIGDRFFCTNAVL